MLPTVSIVIATYNSETVIESALNSVLNQTFQDWECLVVDGMSRDKTVDIVESFCSRDSRFRYISEKDRGIYDAFNKGWKRAKGEWILYLGSDDRLTEDGLDKLLDIIDPKYDIVSGNAYIVFEDGTTKVSYSKGYNGCHQAKLMKKELFEKFGGFDESYRILADRELFMRLANADVKIANYDVIVSCFSLGGISQSFKGIFYKASERYRILKQDKKVQCAWFENINCICHDIYSFVKRSM
ncbi:MAG: glycosyltransferase [Bacteroidales bacterium]|nr:glycosyltransferase [Bacteroidales bacterium]